MKDLVTTQAVIQDFSKKEHPVFFNANVKVVEWHKEDPFPQLGQCVGVDTETEPITETNSSPPMVVLGVFDPASSTCYISYWEDASVFIRELSKREIQQRYFNVGFDEKELNDCDTECTLLEACDVGRVRDMQIRTQLYDIATVGFIPWNHWALEQISKIFCGIQLDKGEKDDPENHRLSFRRGTPITLKQAEYLAWDCISTWAIGQCVPEQATEVTHTKGMILLAHISHNGFPVDMRVYEAFEKKLQEQKDDYRLKLMDFGFPDPYKKQGDENAEQREKLKQQATMFLSLTRQEGDEEKPLYLTKANLRMALVYMYNFTDNRDEQYDFEDAVHYWLTEAKVPNLRKNEKKLYDDLINETGIDKFLNSRKEIVMNAFFGNLFEDLVLQRMDKDTASYNLRHAIDYACDVLDDNPHWVDDTKPVGPKTFLQEHIKDLLARNPKLELETTEKSGDYKLTLKDMWRLEDADVKDPFMECYTTYKHAEKYLSTYLNREYVRADGKIHAKFTNLMKTGRTSCTRPNLQNLPSRDKQYPLKNIFTAPEGAILCATDFSFIELCAFAQTCYSRFGHSVMMDVINAGLDPHRWFAGVMNKIITPDLTHKDDPVWVKEIKAFLEEKVSKEQRQNAKAANFGSKVCRFSHITL